ncbi:unnamed protein product, partial [Prorocentrum cordatum]
MPTGRATIAVGNEEEPHPPPARSSGARPKERRRGAGPPSWRASTPPEKLQNLAQEDRGSAAPVVIFGDAALSCNAIGFDVGSEGNGRATVRPNRSSKLFFASAAGAHASGEAPGGGAESSCMQRIS